MSVILEVTAGPLARQRVRVESGRTLLVGRSAEANLTIPGDNRISSLHFALEVSPVGCRLVDRASTNGTFCNAVRVKEKWIKDGDEIAAGHTTFIAHLTDVQPSAPAGHSQMLRFGHWSLCGIPKGWEILEGQGLRMQGTRSSSISVAFAEEELPTGRTLLAYIENQIVLMKQYLQEPKVEALIAPGSAVRDQGQSLLIRHKAKDGLGVTQRQVYAVSERLVGIATLTALNDDYISHQSELDRFLDSFEFTGGA